MSVSQRQSALDMSADRAYSGFDHELYKTLYEDVDLLNGVSPNEYANIKKSSSQALAIAAYQNCTEFAVVAYWDLEESTDTFECSRYFLIPNPMKRMVSDVGGTQLFEVLYTSQHSKDVFFFFKGYEQQANDDLVDVVSNEFKLQCAFLNLEATPAEIAKIGERRNI